MMARKAHPEDHVRFLQLLETTRDANGVENLDEARKLLAEELAEREDRLVEFAEARAIEVASGFDSSHRPETDHLQMTFDIDTYLVIGESERVRVDLATALHTRRWIDVQNLSKAKHDAAHAKKTVRGYRLLAIQEERGCSMWEAEQILRGDVA